MPSVGVEESEALDGIGHAFSRFCIPRGLPIGQVGILNVGEAIEYFSVREDSALDHIGIDTAFLLAGV